MFRFISILIFFGVCTAQAKQSPESIKLDHNMEVKKIMDDVFMVKDKDYRDSNILVVKMKDGTVFLASSPFENVGTETLLTWVEKTLNPKRIVTVNPHFHMDGTGGNEVYKKNGVEIWSCISQNRSSFLVVA